MGKKASFFLIILIMLAGLMTACSRKDTFERGKSGNNYYENRKLGIRCDVPETYSMKSQQEIKQIMASSLDSFYTDDEERQKRRDAMESTLIYEMFITNDENNSSVSILAEKPENSGWTMYEYVMGSMLDIISSPIEFGKIETGTDIFCGKTAATLFYTQTIDDIVSYTKNYYLKSGDRFVIISFSGPDTDVIETMKGFFSEYHG